KIITTAGEGGMVTTDDDEAWRVMWSFKDHGKDWDAMYTQSHPPGFRWLHGSVGTNWRLTEIQSEIGRIQLRRLPEWTRQRQRKTKVMMSRRPNWRCSRRRQVPGNMEHAQYRWSFYVRPDALKDGWGCDRIRVEAGEQGVPIFSGSCGEVYLETAIDG